MDRPKDDCSIGQPFSGYALRSSPMTDIVIPGILIRKEVFFNEYLSPLSGEPSTPCYKSMAGVERIELPSTVLETVVLPLYDTPNGDEYGIRTRECRRERAVC